MHLYEVQTKKKCEWHGKTFMVTSEMIKGFFNFNSKLWFGNTKGPLEMALKGVGCLWGLIKLLLQINKLMPNMCFTLVFLLSSTVIIVLVFVAKTISAFTFLSIHIFLYAHTNSIIWYGNSWKLTNLFQFTSNLA